MSRIWQTLGGLNTVGFFRLTYALLVNWQCKGHAVPGFEMQKHLGTALLSSNSMFEQNEKSVFVFLLALLQHHYS